MIDLTNLEEIKKLDPKDVYGSTGLFADQCQYMVDTFFDKALVAKNVSGIKNVVVCGMGGSAYGAYVAQTLFADSAKTPIINNNDYHLPGFVGIDSLIMTVSYSGSTEEVLSCANEAKSKGLNIVGFSSGGDLGDFLKAGYPGFTFDPRFNPSGQPRLGMGYVVTGTLLLLKHNGIIDFSKDEMEDAIKNARDTQETTKEAAMDLAQKLYGYIPAIFASEHLVGNAHIVRNQFNETAKSFSAYEDIPELNHHLMEGLKNPTDKKLKALFLTSDLYSDKHKKRFELTKDVVSQNSVETLEYKASGETKLAQVLNVLSFGGYLTFYVALLYGQDPSLIPWVDYFKKKLSGS